MTGTYLCMRDTAMKKMESLPQGVYILMQKLLCLKNSYF